jgi:hypothetical protein
MQRANWRWSTSWRATRRWVGGENKGEVRRSGFEATARIIRHDFGVSWQDEIPGGSVVVRLLPGLSARTMDRRAAGDKSPVRAPLLVIFEPAATR